MRKEFKVASIDDAVEKLEKLIDDSNVCDDAKTVLKLTVAKCFADEYLRLLDFATVTVKELKGMSAPEAFARAKELAELAAA